MKKILIGILIIIIIILIGLKYYSEINTNSTTDTFANTRNLKSNFSNNPNLKSNTNMINGVKANNLRQLAKFKTIDSNRFNRPNKNDFLKRTNIPKNLRKLKNAESNRVKEIENRVLFDNKDYNENLSIDNKDNTYYYTDMINQSNINETAFNIVYSIDPIDYADVKTGIDKCNKKCSGVCFENGYDGIATCYPNEAQPFDWGTLYKNPTFTYGYNAYGPNGLPK